jgi:hypothetical protein
MADRAVAEAAAAEAEAERCCHLNWALVLRAAINAGETYVLNEVPGPFSGEFRSFPENIDINAPFPEEDNPFMPDPDRVREVSLLFAQMAHNLCPSQLLALQAITMNPNTPLRDVAVEMMRDWKILDEQRIAKEALREAIAKAEFERSLETLVG